MMKKEYDVVVMGAGSSGVIAAIASARMGASTCLIEEREVFGGTNTTALVGPLAPFIGENKKQIVDGIPQEIIDELIRIGGSIGHIDDPIGFAHSLTPVDFKALQLVQSKFIQNESNIDVILHNSVVDVQLDDRCIKSVTIKNHLGETDTIYGKTFIDATGDADVVTLAGAEVFIGRESDNKSQPMTMCFNIGNVDLERVRDDVQKNPENFVLDDAHSNGKRMDYVAISGYCDEVKSSDSFPIERDRLLFFQGVREGEVGVNTTRIFDKSSLNPQELIEAEIEGQRQVYELFNWLKENIPAFKDSYIKDVGVIGVRESRHLIGRKVLDEMDVLAGNKQENQLLLDPTLLIFIHPILP